MSAKRHLSFDDAKPATDAVSGSEEIAVGILPTPPCPKWEIDWTRLQSLTLEFARSLDARTMAGVLGLPDGVKFVLATEGSGPGGGFEFEVCHHIDGVRLFSRQPSIEVVVVDPAYCERENLELGYAAIVHLFSTQNALNVNAVGAPPLWFLLEGVLQFLYPDQECRDEARRAVRVEATFLVDVTLVTALDSPAALTPLSASDAFPSLGNLLSTIPRVNEDRSDDEDDSEDDDDGESGVSQRAAVGRPRPS